MDARASWTSFHMITADFKSSLSGQVPAPGISPPLAAMWWAAKGEWGRAHQFVQDEAGVDAAWVHAYLHRVEDDLGNAGYWYRRAGQPVASGPFQVEWDEIVSALLQGEKT
jgi:hypothetical protein